MGVLMGSAKNTETKFDDQVYAEIGQHAELNDFCDTIKRQKKKNIKAIYDFPISYEMLGEWGSFYCGKFGEWVF
jgi:hypothetical protein